jgi:basic amino acid/polyamine antiporter, APA family
MFTKTFSPGVIQSPAILRPLFAAERSEKVMSGNLVKPQIGTGGAIVLGLGAILGSGVFVSLAISVEIAGNGIFLALVLAAIVALCNGLSAAQLAAAHPVSGGTYAYAYRYLHPTAGFIAGGLFLLAKSASAATAALGFASYLLAAGHQPSQYQTPIALVAVLLMTIVAACGLTKSNWLNAAIVGLTLLSLGSFVVVGSQQPPMIPVVRPPGTLAQLSHATALMFVAYTGYGRITTMTEEVRDPERSIPIAVFCSLGLTLLLYLAVASVIVGPIAAGFDHTLIQQIPPISAIAQRFQTDLPIGAIVSGGAIVAMLGVLLNLILGLSRVLMAMGRQGDLPRAMARLNPAQTTPTIAVWTMGTIVAVLVTIGDLKTTWSFSAFNVLIYYALANLCALRLPAQDRRYPPWIAIVGLVSCLSLAFWVEPAVWQAGLGCIALGLLWKWAIGRLTA